MAPKRILTINGWFLAAAGLYLASNDLLGRFLGIGVFKILNEAPLATIGFFEAHMLAALFGIAFIWTARTQSDLKFWNFLAAALHLSLGTANLLFWADTFTVLEAETTATVATIIHFGFVTAEAVAGLKAKNV